jgi:hypothetical protein
MNRVEYKTQRRTPLGSPGLEARLIGLLYGRGMAEGARDRGRRSVGSRASRASQDAGQERPGAGGEVSLGI